jgi:hypothetical protein
MSPEFGLVYSRGRNNDKTRIDKMSRMENRNEASTALS